jgi:hypothetical protein
MAMQFGKDLHDGLEFVALLLILMASARCVPIFFGRPLGLPAGAILIADLDQAALNQV